LRIGLASGSRPRSACGGPGEFLGEFTSGWFHTNAIGLLLIGGIYDGLGERGPSGACLLPLRDRGDTASCSMEYEGTSDSFE